MKNLLTLGLLLMFASQLSFAQSKISLYGGYTFSEFAFYGQADRLDLYSTDYYGHHSPYLALEYEYDYKKVRFSTGISTAAMGSRRYLSKWGVGELYATVPLLAGYQWSFSNNLGLTLEGGLEFGIGYGSLGIVFVDNRNFKYNIGAAIAIEGQWKRFRYGTRFHLGLTDYKYVYNTDGTRTPIKHYAFTFYVGYTLWDAQKKRAKKRKKIARR